MADLEKNIVPYGVQNFADLRRRGLYYVDKTPYIREIELRSDKLFFVRPRRMGKSLFVDMLSRYYDLAAKGDFQELFGDLAIGKRPTEGANSYYVLKLDFSLVGGCEGKTLEEKFNFYLSQATKEFVSRYRNLLDPDIVAACESSPGSGGLSCLLVTMPQRGLPLYVMIDEYDNFTNQMLKTEDVSPYQSITHGDGFYREWFKQFKAGATRLFMTGVSPVTMDDLTSGFNVATNVSQDEGLNAMVGFTKDEVRKILADFNGIGKCRIDVEATLAEIERFYDGYCFSEDKVGGMAEPKESVFNSSMTFYYLQSLVVHGRPPDSMIDRNIRSDRGKLDYLLAIQRHLDSFDGVLPLTEELAAGEEVTFELADAFQVKDIADERNFKLVYFPAFFEPGVKPARSLTRRMATSVVRCCRVFALLLPLAGSAFGEAVPVDVVEWCASTNTVLPSGWVAKGILEYADGGVRFPAKEDYAQSPVYPYAITQIVMKVKSSNLNVESFLTITPVKPDRPDEKRQAQVTDNEYEVQTVVWDRALGVRQIKFQKEGTGQAGWGIAELTIYLDRINAPDGLIANQEFCDAFGASWSSSVEAVRHEVEVREVVPAKFTPLVELDFTTLTNTVDGTKDLDSIPHGDLGIFGGTNLCLAALQGGHLQIGKSRNVGMLSLLISEGVNRTCLTELFRAPAGDTDGEVDVKVVDGAGVTKTLVKPVLVKEKTSFVFVIPDDAVELQFVSLASRRIRMTGVKVVTDYVPSSLSTNLPVVVSSRTNAKMVKHLKPGEWEWRVRSFDRNGVDSPWSTPSRVTLDEHSPPRPKPGFVMSIL